MNIERKQIGMIFCIVLICAITYSNSLFNGFIIDDISIIVQDDFLRQPDAFLKVFSRPMMGQYYRPIVLFSLVLDYSLWGFNPLGYHLSNVLLHTLNSVLFFILLFFIFKDSMLSFLSSMFFAIHPINSVTVNYVSDRGNSLAGLFMLCALLLFYRGSIKKRVVFYLCGFVMFLIALLCRESAILFPLYLLCMLTTIDEPVFWKKNAVIVGTALLMSSMYLFCRSQFMPMPIAGWAEVSRISDLNSLSSFIHMIVRYFMLTIKPVDICFFRPITPLSFEAPVLISLGLFLSFNIFIIRNKELKKKRWFALSWFLIGIIPLYVLMISFRKNIGFVMQDNWIYFSSLGLFLMLGMFLLWLRRWVSKQLVIFLSSMLIIFYAFMTFSTNGLWKNTETYCNFWFNIVPKNSIASWAMAEFYYGEGDVDKAIMYYNKAIKDCKYGYDGRAKFDENLLSIYNNLGALLFEEKRYKEAEEYFKKVIAYKSDDPVAYCNLGNIYLIKNDIPKAKYFYEKSLAGDFQSVGTHKMLFSIYLREGEKKKALYERLTYEYLKRKNNVRATDKQSMSKYMDMSVTLTQLGNSFVKEQSIIDAKRCYKAAVLVFPGNYVGHERLGEIYNQENNKKKADFHSEKAIKLKSIAGGAL